MPITHEESLDHFYKQIDYVLESYQPHGLSVSSFNNIIIGGLGGSGIGGRLTRLAFYRQSPVPVEVFNEYALPAYAGKNTLLILCSYSGETEETLAMFNDAVSRGCTVICLASGGTLKELAIKHNFKFYTVDSGYQPRMALGFSFTTLLMVFGELLGINVQPELSEISAMLKIADNQWKQEGQQMADFFADTAANKFVVVCDLPFEAAAIRFCQQVQENAKGEAFISVLPEANHNMIESYYTTSDTNFIFVNSGSNARINARFQFLKSHLNSLNNKIYEFEAGNVGLKSLFHFIHATDWLSIHLSNIKGENNMEVGIISRLKKFLTEIVD